MSRWLVANRRGLGISIRFVTEHWDEGCWWEMGEGCWEGGAPKIIKSTGGVVKGIHKGKITKFGGKISNLQIKDIKLIKGNHYI